LTEIQAGEVMLIIAIICKYGCLLFDVAENMSINTLAMQRSSLLESIIYQTYKKTADLF